MTTIIAVLLVVAVLVLGAWGVIYLVAERLAMVTKGPAEGSPADVGLPYEEIWVPSGDRRLQAWWLQASAANDAKQAILIYHGNSETLPEWIPALQHLWRHGISSFIFDYSGFGHSSGRATFRTLRQDAVAARRVFEAKAGGRSKYLLGLSLGSGVLLEQQAELMAGACGMILVAAFSSASDVARAWRTVPAPLAYLAPRTYDNVAHIRSVAVPVLIIHSTHDELFPMTMAEKLLAAADDPRNLVLIQGLKHNDMLEGHHAEYLAPAIEYLTARAPGRRR